jgi:hypothetical protein
MGNGVFGPSAMEVFGTYADPGVDLSGGDVSGPPATYGIAGVDPGMSPTYSNIFGDGGTFEYNPPTTQAGQAPSQTTSPEATAGSTGTGSGTSWLSSFKQFTSGIGSIIGDIGAVRAGYVFDPSGRLVGTSRGPLPSVGMSVGSMMPLLLIVGVVVVLIVVLRGKG